MNKIGHIYINGLIGSSDTEKGVELQDVVLQMEAQKDVDAFHVHINSQGGDVDTGRLIANYLAKQSKPVITIAETLCGSIATEIHLAVPLAQRKIVAGTEYFIHNPLIQNVSGDANTLTKAAEYVKVYEKEMLAMYVRATGTDKAALEGLMAQETSLTDEQAKTLGFVSEVIPRIELKAVAFYSDKNKNEKSILNKIEDMNKELLNKVKAVVNKGFEALGADSDETKVNAMMVNTDKGELTYASEGELPQLGEEVMVGEEPAAEGDYQTEDGTIIKVGAEGKVVEIISPEDTEEPEATMETLQAKIDELEAAQAAKDEAHKEEINALMETFKTEVDAKVNEVLEKVGSDFTPKAEKDKGLNKKKAQPVVSMKEQAEARKADYKPKKSIV